MRTTNILLLAGFLFGATPALAQPATSTEATPWYQVELLVIEPREQQPAGESWPSLVDNEIPPTAVELQAAPGPDTVQPAFPQPGAATTGVTGVNMETSTPVAYQLLDPTAFQLNELENRLARNGRYRLITHQAWQQPVVPRDQASLVHLSSKLPEPAEPATSNMDGLILNPPGEQPVETGAGNLAAEFVEAEPPARIDGTVKVSLQRYLHLELNLRYHNPDVYLAEQIARQEDPATALVEFFALRESRRMRSKEIHVFDHPYFSVIALITPVELPATNPTTELEAR